MTRRTMRLVNFLRILLVTGALSGYSAWVAGQRQPGAKPQATADVAGIPLWRRAEVESLWYDPATLFVDVRSTIDYDFGHIAGAISLPDEEFEQRLSALTPRLEQAK